MATDPVCGMDVDEATAAAKSEYKGKIYYFCSSDCKRTFDQDPEKYIDKAQQSSQGGRHLQAGPDSWTWALIPTTVVHFMEWLAKSGHKAGQC